MSPRLIAIFSGIALLAAWGAVSLRKYSLANVQENAGWLFEVQGFSNEKYRGAVHYGVNPGGYVGFIVAVPSVKGEDSPLKYSLTGYVHNATATNAHWGALTVEGRVIKYPNVEAPNMVMARMDGTIDLHRFEPGFTVNDLSRYLSSEKGGISADRLAQFLKIKTTRCSSFDSP